MANRNFKFVKIDKQFFEILDRKNKQISNQLNLARPIGIRRVTLELATADFEKLIDLQLSKKRRILFKL